MASKAGTLAQAVTDALNAHVGWSTSFTAEYKARHVIDNTTLDSLRVLVFPIDIERDQTHRGDGRWTVRIGVVLMVRPAPDSIGDPDPDEVDDVLQLAEEIADYYGPAGAGGVRVDSTSVWQKTEMFDEPDFPVEQAMTVYVILTFLQ
jgi:hypothetical protein